MKIEDYRNTIIEELQSGTDECEISRRIYLTYPTFSFIGKPDREFLIKNKISKEFGVDIYSINFGGSGKTGQSYHKDSFFIPGESDLDAGIISHFLYNKFLEESVVVTRGFKDFSAYGARGNDFSDFQSRLCRGIIDPLLMPDCAMRTHWVEFFENLSYGNTDLFKDVNCWIYSSQRLYEFKFTKTIKLLEKGF